MKEFLDLNKENLKKRINMKWIEPEVQDDNGRLFIWPENEDYMYSIAYNQDGLYKNHKELTKYMGLFKFATDEPRYNLYELTLPLEYFSISDSSFKNLFDLRNNLKKYKEKNIPRDITHILKIKQGKSSKNIKDALKNSGVYYSLKKLLLEYEFSSLVGNLSNYDISLEDSVARFQWIDNIYLLKEDCVTCPNCNKGVLRFNLDNFIENSHDDEWEAKYKCANSLCNWNTTFEDLRRLPCFTEHCYKEQDYHQNFQEANNSFVRDYSYISYEDDYEDYD